MPTYQKGDSNPHGYGMVYAVAADGTAFVLDRKESYDRARSPFACIEWAVHIINPGDSDSEWDETFTKRRDAVAHIQAKVDAIKANVGPRPIRGMGAK